jgi:hypothetical protein
MADAFWLGVTHGKLRAPRLNCAARIGEVSERLKEQHWKCCWRLKPSRGFESPPLRFVIAAVCDC